MCRIFLFVSRQQDISLATVKHQSHLKQSINCQNLSTLTGSALEKYLENICLKKLKNLFLWSCKTYR